MRKLIGLSAAIVAGIAFAGAAQAAQGLSGAYYALSSAPGNVANALNAVAAMSPTATFRTTEVCFGGCGQDPTDNQTLASWLGTSSTDLSANTVTNLTNHAVILTGYLNIAATGTYTYQIGSDDGSQLSIDGSLFLNNDGDHGFGYATGSILLTAGQHSVKIVQFEDGSFTGLTVNQILSNGATVALAGDAISTNATGSVPEPASWAMFIGGFALAGAALRRQRKVAVSFG